MNNQQLISSDITKKQKAVEAQRRYRMRLKAGEPSKEGSETTYASYKKSNAEYMRKYRSEQLKHTQKKIQNIRQKHKRKSQR